MASTTYYSSLAQHQEEFQRGWPILMYHKLGRPTPGNKLRGLYVSEALFGRQLQEWRRSGGQWQSLEEPDSTGLTITFDDGFLSVWQFGLRPLQANGCSAMQYLVPGLLGKTNRWDLPRGEVQEPLMDVRQVREWLAAGHQIGAHTMTHPHLTRIPLAEAREEIFSSKKALEDLFGLPIGHFAYPYGDWSPAIRDIVQEAGFLTATTTEAGVNARGQDPLSLKRYMARHPSRKLFQPWTW